MNWAHNKKITGSVVLVALVLRFAIPAGYMPAELSGGWYLMICPHGLPQTAITALYGGAHSHHHDHESAQAESGYCAVGSAIATVFIPSGQWSPPLLELDRFFELIRFGVGKILDNVWGALPRGPPVEQALARA